MDSQQPQTEEAEIERRQYRRVNLVTQVQCEALERNEMMLTRDVSLGGMFLDGRFPLPLDSELLITFRLYPTEPPITCRARVMFARAGQGMGIQFLDLDAGAQQMLHEYLDGIP